MNSDKSLQLIGAEIRKLREETELSQEKFAHKVDIDRTYYSGIERGERNVSALNLIKIAKGLEVEIGDLFPPVAKLK